jgi:lipopolysaccharide transport system ATP-binding protein
MGHHQIAGRHLRRNPSGRGGGFGFVLNVFPHHLGRTGRTSDDVIIRVENLGKKYRIRHQRRERYRALRDVIAERAGRLFRPRRNNPSETPAVEDFWALQDVSFEIRRGEVLGIIGRNGAGKSTLLKLLSRITEPTAGRIELDGRVASLLEVGTGFHPELSGRENIYLNGAILGMSRMEIRRKFDEIVAFAEVEKFLDTPVKRYSSGMYVRLAFAVAAHLEPEILLVDEVLAVGDEAFQRKCLGKMRAVASEEGRTVIFVSHNLRSVQQLCPTAVLLCGGQLKKRGSARDVIDAYYEQGLNSASPRLPPPAAELLNRCYVSCVAIENLNGEPQRVFRIDEPWRIRVTIHATRPHEALVIAAGLVTIQGVTAQGCWIPPQRIRPGDYQATFEQAHVCLEAGRYSVVIGLTEDGFSIQQIEADWIELTRDGCGAYLPDRLDVGVVLNSMSTSLDQIG